MPDHRTLDRLLQAYAALTRDEAAALRAGNLDAVDQVQKRKSHLLEDLAHIPAPSKRCAAYKSHLAAINHQESVNARLAVRTLDHLLARQTSPRSTCSPRGVRPKPGRLRIRD